MSDRFPSLSSFLSSAKTIEKRTLETALNESTENEIQKILSDSAVRLSVYNNQTNSKDIYNNNNNDNDDNKSTAEFIKEGISDAVALNTMRVKSIIDDLFSSIEVAKEREELWINKLCKLFNIDDSLPLVEKSALIDKQLAEDDDTLNYVTYLVETGEKKITNV